MSPSASAAGTRSPTWVSVTRRPATPGSTPGSHWIWPSNWPSCFVRNPLADLPRSRGVGETGGAVDGCAEDVVVAPHHRPFADADPHGHQLRVGAHEVAQGHG